jgi:PTH1 family peptidyl-tRNA hydrolase
MKYLIAGLGNIGAEYDLTRHNIGFIVLDQLAEKNNVSFFSGRYAFHTDYKYKGRHIYMIKPSTFMNLSGKAVNYWLKELKIPLQNLLVITDDIALPFGKLRLRSKGSSGGHNGLTNIQKILGTEDYSRLRFGVGNDFPKGRQVDYVLSTFSRTEMAELPVFIDKSMHAVETFTTSEIGKAMTEVNKS